MGLALRVIHRNSLHVGLVTTANDSLEEEFVWSHDPHIDPALKFDSSRAGIEVLARFSITRN
jgi:adenine-specific DNA-methyltransferase